MGWQEVCKVRHEAEVRLSRPSSRLFRRLADGSWLPPDRVARISAIMLAISLLAIAALILTAHGTVDRLGRPIGTDFSNVWSAGWMANHGQAAFAWDWARHHAVQQAVHHDPQIPFYGWHYPPPFLLVAALLALLPYLLALLVWQTSTLYAAYAVVRRIVPSRITWLAFLGSPVVFVCVGHGHNGFLTAALLGGGLLLLERKPLVAGLLLGCLVYKPQFALIVPIVLIARWNGRAILGASLSALALIGSTLLIWGMPVWEAFIASLPLTRHVIIEQGATGWEKIQSAFSAIRWWGGSVGMAYMVQGIVTGGAMIATFVTTRYAEAAVRNACVLCAALLSTPYVLDYDMTLLGVAVAFLVADGRRRGFLPWEITSYALALAAPLCSRGIMALTGFPFGFIATSGVMMLACRRLAGRLDHRHAAVDV